jgi:hypothetical protein
MKTKISEKDFAKYIIQYLTDFGYEIYQEYETSAGNIIDIVAKSGNIIWAIETKLSLSLDVIYQAKKNLLYCHFSSICVPSLNTRGSKSRDIAEDILNYYGIGMFTINKYGGIDENIKPSMNRKNFSKRLIFNESRKSYAEAGNSNGHRWTPFQQTKDELINYVKENPGCRLKDAVDNINHHYSKNSNANASLRHWISTGVIKNIIIDKGKLYDSENNQ